MRHSLIKNLKRYPAKNPGQKMALVLCGFGGSIWQTKRLLRVLHKAGYDVAAIDFPGEVLSQGDPQLLPRLMDEAVNLAESEAKKTDKPILLIGISLGALVSLNILRRSKLFDKGVLITGGDIVKVAHNIYGRKVWPQAYDVLAEAWQDNNMYTPPEKLVGKRLLFVLPSKDRLIDPTDVRGEARVQTQAGNKLILIERHSLGHIGTIIEETVLFPKRILGYIQRVEG
jgi:pimeloyl-ACP methyl ester carboxylesterase